MTTVNYNNVYADMSTVYNELWRSWLSKAALFNNRLIFIPDWYD